MVSDSTPTKELLVVQTKQDAFGRERKRPRGCFRKPVWSNKLGSLPRVGNKPYGSSQVAITGTHSTKARGGSPHTVCRAVNVQERRRHIPITR